MQYTGEIISLFVAFSWTATALFAEVASKRFGALTLNIFRMTLSLVMLSVTLWCTVGSPVPSYADSSTWFWLAVSGLVGYVFGDFCLFNAYMIIGSRYGQLFMTLAPPVAGVAGWLFLGERLSAHAWLAMAVTLSGIALTILAKKGKNEHGLKIKLPVKGVLFGIGAGVGQGLGLVLSKIGLEKYALCLPSDASEIAITMVPFAGTFIRAVFALIGFIIIKAILGTLGTLKKAVTDKKGMTFTALTTFFGPFLGVSLSLMAVQYAEAGIASTIMALTPVLIIVPYSIIYHQKVSAREVIGTVVSMVGIGLFFS